MKKPLPGPCNRPYWERVRHIAAELKSDGCTCVSEIFHDACLEHDIHWRTGRTVYGDPISCRDANARFRQQCQARSPLGKLSPLSLIRWLGVSVAAPFIYHPEDH